MDFQLMMDFFTPFSLSTPRIIGWRSLLDPNDPGELKTILGRERNISFEFVESRDLERTDSYS
jgi:hypothetical protein